jgi:hypothetical protein
MTKVLKSPAISLRVSGICPAGLAHWLAPARHLWPVRDDQIPLIDALRNR